MRSIDGFVIPVATANKQACIDQARTFDNGLMQAGALPAMKCWSEDVPHGQFTDFHRSAQAAVRETVVFGGVEWPDEATPDVGFARVEARMKTDSRFKAQPRPLMASD